MNPTLKLILHFLLVFLIPFAFSNRSEGNELIDEELQQIFETHQLMGMSVLAVHNDDIIYNGSFGLAEYDNQVAVTDSTMYRVASISKTATAIAFMMLVEQNLVSLDDNISDLLGYEVSNPYSPDTPITPRMLLSHTSTLQDGSGYSSFLGATYANPNPPNLSELINPTGDYYTPGLWIQKQPGEYFTYCNLNYGILGTLIEKISDQRFDLFVQEHILAPLQIAGSFNIHNLENPDNLSVLYRKPGGNWTPQADHFPNGLPEPLDYSNYKPGTNGLIFAPQGGLRISAKDLAKIMLLLKNMGQYQEVELLQETTVANMYEEQWTYNGMNGNNYYNLFNSWGLGIQRVVNREEGDIVVPDYNMYGHAGEAYGLISDMYFHMTPDFGIIFITNGSAQPFEFGDISAFYKVEEEIFQLLYTDLLHPLIETQNYNIQINIEGKGTTNPPSGSYEMEDNTDFSIEAIPDQDWSFSHFLVAEQIYESNPLNITIDNDLIVTAVFTPVSTYSDNDLWVEKSTKIKFLPNYLQLTVEYSPEDQNRSSQITIHNMAGQSIFSKSVSKGSPFQHIDLSGIRPGIYIATLRNISNILKSKKFVLL